MAYPSNRFGSITDQNKYGYAECKWSLTQSECEYILTLPRNAPVYGPIFITICRNFPISWRLKYYPNGCGAAAVSQTSLSGKSVGHGGGSKTRTVSVEENRLSISLHDAPFDIISDISCSITLECLETIPTSWTVSGMMKFTKTTRNWGYANTIGLKKILTNFKNFYKSNYNIKGYNSNNHSNNKNNFNHANDNKLHNSMENKIVLTLYCYLRINSILDTRQNQIYPMLFVPTPNVNINGSGNGNGNLGHGHNNALLRPMGRATGMATGNMSNQTSNMSNMANLSHLAWYNNPNGGSMENNKNKNSLNDHDPNGTRKQLSESELLNSGLRGMKRNMTVNSKNSKNSRNNTNRKNRMNKNVRDDRNGISLITVGELFDDHGGGGGSGGSGGSGSGINSNGSGVNRAALAAVASYVKRQMNSNSNSNSNQENTNNFNNNHGNSLNSENSRNNNSNNNNNNKNKKKNKKQNDNINSKVETKNENENREKNEEISNGNRNDNGNIRMKDNDSDNDNDNDSEMDIYDSDSEEDDPNSIHSTSNGDNSDCNSITEDEIELAAESIIREFESKQASKETSVDHDVKPPNQEKQTSHHEKQYKHKHRHKQKFEQFSRLHQNTPQQELNLRRERLYRMRLLQKAQEKPIKDTDFDTVD